MIAATAADVTPMRGSPYDRPVTYESINRRQRQERAAEELMDSLDAVSAPMAERILGRAIQAEAEHRARNEDTFDYEELVKIAREVGVSEASLRQALLEEFDTELDRNPSLTERLTVPDEVRGGVIVDRSDIDVEEAMKRVEERIQQRMNRRIDAMVEAVQQRDGRRTLVEVKSSTKPNRKRAIWLIMLLVFFGPLLARLLASVLIVGLAGLAIVGVVGFMKRVGRRFRKAVNEGLASLLEEDEQDQSAEMLDWLEVWERSRKNRQ